MNADDLFMVKEWGVPGRIDERPLFSGRIGSGGMAKYGASYGRVRGTGSDR